MLFTELNGIFCENHIHVFIVFCIVCAVFFCIVSFTYIYSYLFFY